MKENNYWSRTISRRRALATGATAGLGAASIGLVGCGSGDDAVKQDARPIEVKQEEVKSILSKREDTTARAVKGGIMEFYTATEATNLDPLSSPSFTASAFATYMYPRLVRYKAGYRVPANGVIEPSLAQSWEQPEPTKLVFKLRPNALWDERAPTNKRIVDAEDVVFSWNKYAAKSIDRKALANSAEPTAPVLKAEAVDKSTVVFTLAFPYAPLLSMLGYARYMQIMPRESEGGFNPLNETRGSGPYILQNYQKNVRFEYRKNPNYWDADKVLNDGFNLPIIPEYSAGLAQFKAKKIWSFGALRQEDVIPTKKDLPDLVLDQGAFGRGQSMLFFGMQPGSPFNDPRVKQAASMMIDRELYVDTFFNITAFKAEGYPAQARWHSHVSGGWDGYWSDPLGKELGEGAKNFQLNVAEAKKLLSAAGFPNGLETEFAYISTGQYGTTFPKQGEALMGMLQESGAFKLKLVNPDYQTDYLPKYYYAKGDFKGIAWGATTGFPEVDAYMFSYFHSAGARQKTSFQGTVIDKKSDDLIMAQRQELNAQKRVELIKEWQRYQSTNVPIVLSAGQAAPFTLVWPWLGNSGVFRGWDGESDLGHAYYPLWFDKSKFTG